MMQLSEAKAYIGKVCAIRWQDRSGAEQVTVSKIYDATFVPLYGGYVVTDSDDIRLDRIVSMAISEATSHTDAAVEQKVAA
jgi:hypothetical protein